MITEEGTIKVSTAVDARVQKELNGKSFIIGLICSILGGAGVLAGFIFYIIEIIKDRSGLQFFAVMICFAVVLGLGIALVIIVRKANKSVEGGEKSNTYEFFTDYFTITEFYRGEQVANAKVYNNQITKSKETKNYLLFFINSVSAYPVAKDGLSQKELDELRRIFRLTTEISLKEEK